ncbi:MAG: hypothetical protein Aurels2KO_42470 [Aureliella sp.]
MNDFPRNEKGTFDLENDANDSSSAQAEQVDGLPRANFQKSYLTRYTLLAAVCLGMCAWFAYDGFVAYPAKLVVAQAFEEVADLSGPELEDRWNEITSEKGWKSKRPEKKAEEIRSDITEQYFWAALTFALGVPALVLLFRSRGSWVQRTESGLETSWGQTVHFADVQSLNKRRWEKKGIARAAYTDGEATRYFTFDDFKFEREPLGQILRDLEETLTDEQVTGGLKEVAAEAKKAAEKAAEEASNESEEAS